MQWKFPNRHKIPMAKTYQNQNETKFNYFKQFHHPQRFLFLVLHGYDTSIIFCKYKHTYNGTQYCDLDSSVASHNHCPNDCSYGIKYFWKMHWIPQTTKYLCQWVIFNNMMQKLYRSPPMYARMMGIKRSLIHSVHQWGMSCIKQPKNCLFKHKQTW